MQKKQTKITNETKNKTINKNKTKQRKKNKQWENQIIQSKIISKQ